MFSNIWKEKKIIKDQAGFKLMTFKFRGYAQTPCATLLGDNFGGKQLYNIIFTFNVNFDWKYVTI